ncbi:hypothetical protein EST38_g5732 [Candolleomyces aberdarensis]|uniref:Uncharacterized protein n=1 Tax=Candolleomyces aberdarensis TaxID=2316362 RepID=A0A4Q2DLS5_9AGAR|nr:hypothetical protein EST38_g5732 [Candolleomyces aberdarensis]
MLTKLNNTFPLILALLITIQSCNGAPTAVYNRGYAGAATATSVARDPTELQLFGREPSSFRYKNPTPDKTSDAPPVNVTEGP